MHIALTSRPLTDAERAAGAREIEYARTPFAIVVRHDSRIESITRTQIATYFSGAVDSGPDGVRVRPVLRPALSRCLTDSTQAARTHKNKRTLNDL